MFVRLRSRATGLGQIVCRKGDSGRGWYRHALKQKEVAEQKAAAIGPEYDYFIQKARGGEAKRQRKMAFMEISRENESLGKVVIELADDVVPRTVENFISLCEGHKKQGDAPGYKGSLFNSIRKGHTVSAGEPTDGEGTGGHSALGTRYFDDENFALRHSEPGVISMANSGVHRNASKFFVITSPQPHLDGRNVAFGKVVEGMNVIKEIESAFHVNGKPIAKIRISDCGAL